MLHMTFNNLNKALKGNDTAAVWARSLNISYTIVSLRSLVGDMKEEILLLNKDADTALLYSPLKQPNMNLHSLIQCCTFFTL